MADAKEIAPGIRYVGVDDLDLDLFEGQYPVPEGMAYNAYVLLDDQVAVLDTVDARKVGKWLQNVEEALEGRRPDFLVVHHVEPDHSGGVAAILEKWPGVCIVASEKAIQFLGQFLPQGVFFASRSVKEGDVLDLGGHVLRFFSAPMVHWPEVMVSLDEATGTLFAADAFGKFGALSRCGFWADEEKDWACEARRYYFNICGRYGAQVAALLGKLSGARVGCIAPLHGPIIRKELERYLSLYATWSSYGVETEGVAIACASIHGHTLAAAGELARLLRDRGVSKVALSDLTRCDLAEAVEDAFRYGTLVLAASSYDGGVFSPMHNFLHTLQMKGWQRRRVAFIENGTWAPCAARTMRPLCEAMKEVTFLDPVVTLRGRLRPQDQPVLEALVDAICRP